MNQLIYFKFGSPGVATVINARRLKWSWHVV